MSTFQIKTSRLILNPPTKADIPNIVSYAGSKEVYDNTLMIPHPYFEKDAVWWIENSRKSLINERSYTLAIRLKEKPELLGAMSLWKLKEEGKCEVGYWVGKPFWNNGYATEALKGIISFAFDELKMDAIVAANFAHNIASGKVMKKAGMKEIERIKNKYEKDGKRIDGVHHEIRRQHYLDNK